MGTLKPTQIRRLPDRLHVEWQDGRKAEYSYAQLRQVCPCARCQSTKTDQIPNRMLPGRLEVIEIQPVGRYAIRLIWNDGHRTGIYTYEFLHALEGNLTNDVVGQVGNEG